ncbi:MAG: alpha/beta fold hydrolase [Actinomycetota bacterium]|nr:alpha/beta fold hydrolase [Actinomycetota bacterium]
MLGRGVRSPLAGVQTALNEVDRVRRRSGQVLDALGAGPHTTPSRTFEPTPGVRLRAYSPQSATGPVVLLVPAPIKRWYVWDLQPDRSVVARCVAAGMRVFLAEWTDAGPDEQERGLEEYGDTLLLACLHEVREQTGAHPALLAGHSLGGTLAAIFAARRPQLVAGLVLLEAPLRFGPDAGAFAPLVAAAPPAGWLRPPRQGVPGSFLDAVSAAASPRSFQLDRYLDLTRSLADPAALATHVRVERWTLDEFAVPGRLFEDVVERLYRSDELMAGRLAIDGVRVGPASVTAPMLNVLDPRSRVVPPRSVLPFHAAAASRDKRVLHYRGDIGVALQHVGVLVGRRAHRDLWPQLLAWMHTTWGS